MSKKIKAIIIDDEERARNVLSSMLSEFCPEIELVSVCESVPQGVLEINRKNPNVVFLDIEMPNYSGFELLDFFKEIDFEIIFVTAYNKYALRAFEVSAIDYILKPIRVDLLEGAVRKLKEKIEVDSIYNRFEILRENLKTEKIQKIAVPVSGGLVFVKVSDISHIGADGSYSKLFLNDGTNLFISKNLKYFETMLSNHNSFFRIHRSHLINMKYIKRYNRNDGDVTLENNQRLHISRACKNKFEEKLKGIIQH